MRGMGKMDVISDVERPQMAPMAMRYLAQTAPCTAKACESGAVSSICA